MVEVTIRGEHHSVGMRVMIPFFFTLEQIWFREMEMTCLNSETRCGFQHDCWVTVFAQPADTLTHKLNKYTYIICPIYYLLFALLIIHTIK